MNPTLSALTIGFTALIASQSIVPIASASITPSEVNRASYIQSWAALNACRSYQSRNTWVGQLINARHSGGGMFTCDFTRASTRVNYWGQ
jgi:hypothetical protein